MNLGCRDFILRTTRKIVGPPDSLSWWSCGPLLKKVFVKPIGHTPNIANHVFCHVKNIWWLNFIFSNFIQLAKLSGAYFCRFFGKKYFTSSDPFFVMYNDRCKSFIIRAVGDIKSNSRKTLYITKKGSPKLKYFSNKNYTWRSPDMLVSWIEVKNNNFSW